MKDYKELYPGEECDGCFNCGGMGGDWSTPMPHDFEEAEDRKWERYSEPPCPRCGRVYQGGKQVEKPTK